MLDKLLADHRTGQDASQLGSFVLGGRTPWGTYKQALRELYKRIRGLRQLITDRDLLELDIEELELSVVETDIEKRRKEIKLMQMQGNLEELNRSVIDTEREAALFYRVASQLKEELGEITEDKRAQLDREDWRWWHIKKAILSKLTTGRVGEVVLKNLMSIPISERNEWLSVIKDDNNLVEMLENSEYGRIETNSPSDEEIKFIKTEISHNHLLG